MKLSRTILYALQATLQLAEAGPQAPIPCSRLAEAGKMPERFLLQILRNLVTHGLLRSTRGVDGGYSLHRQPDQITLLDIIEAIDGPLDSDLPRDEGMDAASAKKLHEAIERVNEQLRVELSSIRLTDLMSGSKTKIYKEEESSMNL
ncbi:HTH-type transcriptional regulator CymR [Planctomycetales bacterium 10988]|nr:HTH-type transcriptional regulator CymR [Planctomycetales bacterium 10988]